MGFSSDKKTGKASYFKFNGSTVPITKYSPKVSQTLADDTDTGNYDPTSDLVHKSQTAVDTQLELSVEGKFRVSSTMSLLVASLYDYTGPVPVVLGLDAGTKFGHGDFDISDFSADVGIGDTINWTATLKSNGIFTPGS